MASNCTVVNNIYHEKNNDNILKLESVYEIGQELQTKITNEDIICENRERRFSYGTVFNEIKVIVNKENEFVESVRDPIQQLKDPIWGEMTIRGEYNIKRECIKLDLINIHPKRNYYKHKRKHFISVKIFCKEKLPNWISGCFDLNNINPKYSSWSFENLPVDKLKKSYLEIKLFRMRKSFKSRLLADGRIDFTDIYTQCTKPKSIILKSLYYDKPEKVKPPSEQKLQTKKSPIKKLDEEIQNDDELPQTEVELKYYRFELIKPEIFIGFGYNCDTSILTIDVRKCIHLLLLKGKHIELTETYAEVHLNPEKSISVTNSFYRTESPEFKQKFQYTLFLPSLKMGDVTFFIFNNRNNKRMFSVTIDRETDNHWAEMQLFTPDIVYMWHDLLRYSKERK